MKNYFSEDFHIVSLWLSSAITVITQGLNRAIACNNLCLQLNYLTTLNAVLAFPKRIPQAQMGR